MKRHGTSNRGFTLVELLVVIAIIAILIAILLPVLARVRQHARGLQCQTNLRQLGQAMTMYTQQYKCFPGLVFMDNNPTGGGAYSWPVLLRKQLGGNQKVFYCPAQDLQCQWNDENPGFVKRATEVHTSFGYELGERLVLGGSGTIYGMDYGTWFSYGANFVGAHMPQSSTDARTRGMGGMIYQRVDQPPWMTTDQTLRRAASVRSPSEFIIIADATADGVNDTEIIPMIDGVPGARKMVGNVHRGGANVLFLDGHVQWYLQSDLICKWVPIPDEAWKQRMWNYDHKAAIPGLD